MNYSMAFHRVQGKKKINEVSQIYSELIGVFYQIPDSGLGDTK